MKGLFRYLSPFAPDISGAVSVLYELGGIIVILDAGGCAGNTCGFDEPRWFSKKSAIYSAGLRDLDAILGRDDELLDKIGQAVETTSANFIALVGTPVPAVIATDYHALSKLCEKRFGLPCLYMETTGMKYYDVGQQMAYAAIDQMVEKQGSIDTVYVGATPLDVPYVEGNTLTSLASFAALPQVKQAIVMSVSGLSLVRKYQIPYTFGFDLGHIDVKPKKTLILSQQVWAHMIRQWIGQGDVASFFMMDQAYMQENDVHLDGEMDLVKLVCTRKYERILCDPLLMRALPDYTGEFVPLPHFAVSGQLYQKENIDTYLADVERAL